ncbi:MAG: PQQ-like beta-propeller repeat protein [Phycisphaerales bacterium]|nr:MAG: PQQ-like beta-propeller repeat protein [Phycisphaerales bacterium]
MKRFLSLLMLILAVAAVDTRADWPQYLGPHRNASAPEAKIARAWPEAGPRKLWSFPLGKGYGGASVQGGEVFVLDRVVGKSDILRCIDLDTGKERWNFSYDAPGKNPHPGSRSVPTVDEEYVWIVGPFGHFHCVSRETHQAVWKKNLLEQFEAKKPGWGVAQSPLLYRDTVIVAPQGEKGGVVAFEKKTGVLRWASRKLTGHSCHVSPVLASLDGVDQVIMISPCDRKDEAIKNEVVAFDASTGRPLWTYAGLTSFACIAPLTVIDGTRVFLTDCSYNGSYQPVSIMLEAKRRGGGFVVRELWKTEEVGSKIHPAVLHEGYLYVNNCGKPKGLMCLALDGKIVWEKGSAPDFHYGALILADGLILGQDGTVGNGGLHLIEPRPDGYKELAKAGLLSLKGDEPWAPLAFSDGKLLARNGAEMICLDLQNP